jgi:hypothetical protein
MAKQAAARYQRETLSAKMAENESMKRQLHRRNGEISKWQRKWRKSGVAAAAAKGERRRRRRGKRQLAAGGGNAAAWRQRWPRRCVSAASVAQ